MNLGRRMLPCWALLAVSSGLLLGASPASGQRFAGSARLANVQPRASAGRPGSGPPSDRQAHLANLATSRASAAKYQSRAASSFAAYGHSKNPADLRAGQRATVRKNEAKIAGLKEKEVYQRAQAATAKDPKKAQQHRANARQLRKQARSLRSEVTSYEQKNGLKASNVKTRPARLKELARAKALKTSSASAKQPVAETRQASLDDYPSAEHGSSGTRQTRLDDYPSGKRGSSAKQPVASTRQTRLDSSPSGRTRQSNPQRRRGLARAARGSTSRDDEEPAPSAGTSSTIPEDGGQEPAGRGELPPPANAKEAGDRARFQLATHDFQGLATTMSEIESMPRGGVLDGFRNWRTQRAVSRGLTKMATDGLSSGDVAVGFAAAATLSTVSKPGFWTDSKLRGIARAGLRGAYADTDAARPEDAVVRYQAATGVQELAGGKGLRGALMSWQTRHAIKSNLHRDLRAWSKEGNLDAFNKGEAATRALAEFEGKPLSPSKEATLERLRARAASRSAERALDDANDILDGQISLESAQAIVEESAARIQYAKETAAVLKAQGFAAKAGRFLRTEGKFNAKLQKTQDKLDRYVTMLSSMTDPP